MITMMNKQIIESTGLFRSISGENSYYDPLFDYCIYHNSKYWCLNHHCEVNGDLDFICNIEDEDHFYQLIDLFNIHTKFD